MAADPYYYNHSGEAGATYQHPGYRPRGYQPSEPRAYGAPSRDTQLTTYEGPSTSQGYGYPPQEMPPYRQGYHQNQYTPQHNPSMGFTPQQYLSRRDPGPDQKHSPSPPQSPDPQHDLDETSEAEKERKLGGGMIGAATGVMLGSKLGGQKGHAGLGTIGGLIAGAIGGHKIEDKIDERKRKKHKEYEQQNGYQSDSGSRNGKHGGRAQTLDDDDDHEYRQAAYAAPGYGSSLLPSDTSHGGHRNRRHRSRGSRYSDSESN